LAPLASALAAVDSRALESHRSPATTGEVQTPADPKDGAGILRTFSGAAVLSSLAGPLLKSLVPLAGFKHYRDQTLAEIGQALDPIAEMLVDELLWAHHRLGQLHAEAANAKTPELIEVLNGAATKLMAEQRRSALALREYRAPIISKHVTVMQQNVAETQQVAFVEGGQPRPAPKENPPSNELVSNSPHLLNHDNSPNFNATTAGRQSEPAPAARPHGRGSPAAATGGLGPPALDSLHRPPDRDR